MCVCVCVYVCVCVCVWLHSHTHTHTLTHTHLHTHTHTHTHTCRCLRASSCINASSYSYSLSGQTTKVALTQKQTSVFGCWPVCKSTCRGPFFFFLFCVCVCVVLLLSSLEVCPNCLSLSDLPTCPLFKLQTAASTTPAVKKPFKQTSLNNILTLCSS